MRKLIFRFFSLFFPKFSKALPPHNLLIIRSGAIGDVLMTTPLVRAIREYYPKAEITYLVGEWSKGAIETNPSVDKIISFRDEIVAKKKLFGVYNLIKKIRRQKFDRCFILDKSYIWNLFAWLCKIPVRVGFDRFGEGFPNTYNVQYDGTKHEVDYYMDIAKLIGAKIYGDMEFFVPKKDEDYANRFFLKNKISNVVGIAPGGAGNPGQKLSAKRWPVGKYAELVTRLLNANDVLIFGGKNDMEIAKSLLHSLETKTDRQIIDLAGKLNLKQAAAMIKKCKLIISNDSGPMHLAVAVKTQVIGIFGPTDPNRFGPRVGKVVTSKFSCGPCYDAYGRFKKCRDYKCIEKISVDEVIRKIKG